MCTSPTSITAGHTLATHLGAGSLSVPAPASGGRHPELVFARGVLLAIRGRRLCFDDRHIVIKTY
jgi:hypothetical protein